MTIWTETCERPQMPEALLIRTNKSQSGTGEGADRFAFVDEVIERFLSGNSWHGRISITIRRYAHLVALPSGMPTDGEFQS
jgi:hypothetical protein